MIPPASTGKDNNNNTAVITTAHPNKANLCNLIPGVLIFTTVVIKFIDPNKLLTPDKCKANIAKSTLGPLWLCNPDKGGYKVQPVGYLVLSLSIYLLFILITLNVKIV